MSRRIEVLSPNPYLTPYASPLLWSPVMPISRRDFLANAAAATSFSILKPSLVFGSQANSKIEVGIVGLGGRGSLIADLLTADPNYQIVAVADYFPEVVNKAGDRLKVPPARRFSGLLGYKRLIESHVDAVILEAPPYCFPDQAQAAADAGCHVYMAKPVAVDVPGCLRIAEIGRNATAAKKAFLVDFQMRTDPYNQEVVKKCHEGMIGELALLSSFYCSEGFADPEFTDTIESRLQNLIWTNDIALGGGHFVNAGIHAIDAAIWIAGELPVSAQGYTRIARKNSHGDSPDADSLTYRFKSGLLLNHRGEHIRNTHEFICTCSAYGLDGYLEVTYDGKVFVRGNKGGYPGGVVQNLYVDGIKRNLDTFQKNIRDSVSENPTLMPGVNSTLAAILGREAGLRGDLLTWDQLLQEYKKVEPNLSGLTP